MMTKTELTRLRLKQGKSVGFKNSAGLIRPVGHLNQWPKDIQKKIKEQINKED